MQSIFFSKKNILLAVFSAGLLFSCLTACRVKSGCPSNADMAPKVGKNGEIKVSKKSRQELFSKEMRKRMKKN